MNRRKFVTTGITAISVLIAGCSDGDTDQDENDQEMDRDPDPEVINTESEGDFGTIVTGDVDVTVEVENRGRDGEIEVILDIRDADGTRIDAKTQIIHIESGETATVDFGVSIDEGAEYFEAMATPAA